MNDAMGHEGRAVPLVGHVGVAVEMVGEYSFVPGNIAHDTFGIGIKQELRRITAMTLLWVPGPAHAITVMLSRFHPREVAMPAVAGDFRHGYSRLPAGFIEQAQFDALGDLGKN